MSLEDMKIRPDIGEIWRQMAAGESRPFRADLAGRPRLHGTDMLPSTKAGQMRDGTNSGTRPDVVLPHKNP